MSKFSSRDFWRVAPAVSPQPPQRLHHPAVAFGQGDCHAAFSTERHHRVHIVDLPSATISMTIGHLAPGQATRLHRHNYETILYILSGAGVSVIASEHIEWCAGDAVYIPVWAPHQHINRSETDDANYIACENAPLLQNLGIAMREEL